MPTRRIVDLTRYATWVATGESIDYGKCIAVCGACGQKGLRYHYGVRSPEGDETLLIGSSCIEDYTPLAKAQMVALRAAMRLKAKEAKAKAKAKVKEDDGDGWVVEKEGSVGGGEVPRETQVEWKGRWAEIDGTWVEWDRLAEESVAERQRREAEQQQAWDRLWAEAANAPPITIRAMNVVPALSTSGLTWVVVAFSDGTFLDISLRAAPRIMPWFDRLQLWGLLAVCGEPRSALRGKYWLDTDAFVGRTVSPIGLKQLREGRITGSPLLDSGFAATWYGRNPPGP